MVEELDGGLQAIRSRGGGVVAMDAGQERVFHRRICSLRSPRGHVGTGFLIGPDRVLTANHVLEFAKGDGGVQYAVFDFDANQVQGGPAVQQIDVGADPLAHSATTALDFAILQLLEPNSGGQRLQEMSRDRGHFLLCSQAPQRENHAWVLGHLPLGDPATTTVWNLQTMPGRFVDHNSEKTSVAHDADTLPGSSGSPVLTKEYRLVAVHRRAEPGAGQNNHAVPIWAIIEALIEQEQFDLFEIDPASTRPLRIPSRLRNRPAAENAIPEPLREYVEVGETRTGSAASANGQTPPSAGSGGTPDATLEVSGEGNRPAPRPAAQGSAPQPPSGGEQGLPQIPRTDAEQQWVNRHRDEVFRTLRGYADVGPLLEIWKAMNAGDNPVAAAAGLDALAAQIADGLVTGEGLDRKGPVGRLNALRRRWQDERPGAVERLRLALDYTFPIRLHRPTARRIVEECRQGATTIVGTAYSWGCRVVMALVNTDKYDQSIGRPGFSNLNPRVAESELALKPPRLCDPRTLLDQIVATIASHVGFSPKMPASVPETNSQFSEYCGRLNNKLQWLAEENGCEFFTLDSAFDAVEQPRRDSLLTELRRLIREIYVLRLDPDAASRFDEDDLDNLLTVWPPANP